MVLDSFLESWEVSASKGLEKGYVTLRISLFKIRNVVDRGAWLIEELCGYCILLCNFSSLGYRKCQMNALLRRGIALNRITPSTREPQDKIGLSL